MMKDDLRQAMLDAVRSLRKKRRAMRDAVGRLRRKGKAKGKAKPHAQASSGKALDKGGIADTAAGEKAESATDTEPVVKRRRIDVKKPGDKKLDDKVHKETPMSKLTHTQDERLVCVQSKLQDTFVLLHASFREASKHKGTKVPNNTLDKAKAITAEIVKFVTMASDIHAAGKMPRGMFLPFLEDAKRAIDVAKEVSAKMSSLLVD